MSQFRNLVFEGGGVKGIGYSGAIKVLQQQGILGDITRVGGTSAGAITACLLGLGASGDDVTDIVGHTSYRKFMDDSFSVIQDANRLMTEYGWYKGDAFADWIKKLIYSFVGDAEVTFADLHAMKEDKRKKLRDLYVVGTSLSMRIPQVYSAEDTPDVPVWLAVRISMSIPLFFAAVIRDGRVHVDGGVTWNYPIDLFDDKRFVSLPAAAVKPKYTTLYDDDHVYNKETLGLRLETKDEIKAEKEAWRRPAVQIDNLLDYSKVLVSFMLDSANKSHLHQNDWHRTIFIDAGGIRATQFDLSDAQVQTLVNSGQTGAQEYLAWFNDPTVQPINRV